MARVLTFRVLLLAVLPLTALALSAYAWRPQPYVVAPIRLAIVRAAVAVGAYAVIAVEAAGALRALTRAVVLGVWLAGVAAAGCAAWLRRMRDRRDAGTGAGPGALAGRAAAWWRTAGRPVRVMAGCIGGLALGELVVALWAAPNNFDSQTYHLPRIEHWVAQRDVAFFATAIHRQVTLAPGAEYLLLHLRLLTGGDGAYNLLQWCAGLGCLVVASRIVAQFGGSARAQALVAFLVAATPLVILQSSSTQNDLVAAAWTGCLATLVLDGVAEPARFSSVLSLGTAAGLVAVTKDNGLLAGGPLLVVWVVAQLWRGSGRVGRPRATLRTGGAALGVLALMAVLAGPYIARVTAEFGNPLGPPRLTDSIPMQRHDPAAILVNGLRIAHTALDTPVAPLSRASAAAIMRLSTAIGVDPQDRRITFEQEHFPVAAWYPDEDRAAFPLTGTLALIGLVVAVARPGRLCAGRAAAVRGYALAVACSGVLYAATVKWQPWGNRLLLYGLVLALPLAALWIDALLIARPATRSDPAAEPARRRPVARTALVATLAVSALAGTLTIVYGYPRAFAGPGSIFAGDDWATRFRRRPQWEADYRWAAQRINATHAHRLGLVERNNDWEYPWWLLLPGRDIVSLRSVLPHHPPADPASVDAEICTAGARLCARYLPHGWHLSWHGLVSVALPPTVGPSTSGRP